MLCTFLADQHTGICQAADTIALHRQRTDRHGTDERSTADRRQQYGLAQTPTQPVLIEMNPAADRAPFSCLLALILALAPLWSRATEKAIDVNALYRQLHANPELSFQEEQTSALLALKLRQLGYSVNSNIGGFGVVAVMKNGDGPTVMLRADMDALPVSEETGLEYASSIKATGADGSSVPVMHACGHDIHMSVLIGTAQRMVKQRDKWRGTLMLIAQPAEELGAGARAMLEDGLFQRFPRPDYNLALHVSAELPAGTIGYTSGYSMANVDSVDILIRGIGGHGAYPHKTKDPVVIAAQLIMWLQTIVSREISPLESAVITVGSIHGGTKHNIIGDEVKLQLTVRSYSDETRNYLLKRIREISIDTARTAGITEDLLPLVSIREAYTPSVFNDPAFMTEVVDTLKVRFGGDRIVPVPPVMAGEDFARYSRVDPPIPGALLWLGSVEPNAYQAAQSGNQTLPALHSPRFAPLAEHTIETGVEAMSTLATELLSK